MGQVYVRASRRSRAYTRRTRLNQINSKVNKRLSRGGLTLKRENQLYKLQKNVRASFAKETEANLNWKKHLRAVKHRRDF